MKLSELLAKRTAHIGRMRALTDQESMTEDEAAEFDRLQGEVGELDKQIDRLQTVDELERSQEQPATRASRPGAPAHNRMPRGDNREQTERLAVRLYVNGDEGAIREIDAQMRSEACASNDTTNNITTPADGGYLVPTGHYNGIIARAEEMLLYPRLGVLNVPGLGTTVNVPTGGAAQPFVATNESGTQDRDGAAIGQAAMTLVKFTKKLELTDELLQDEGSGLLNYLNGLVGDAYALTHNSGLVTEVLAGGTSVTLGAIAAASVGDIPLLVGSVKDSYAEMSQWLMKRATRFKYQALQGTDFLFAPTPSGDDRQMWGYPTNHSEYMPAVGSGNKSLAFGAFRYMGVRTTGMTFLRDPYSNADKGEVVLRYYTRIIYKVLQAEAIVYGKHPTA